MGFFGRLSLGALLFYIVEGMARAGSFSQEYWDHPPWWFWFAAVGFLLFGGDSDD